MSQKQLKRYRKAAQEAAQKLIDGNLTVIRDELLKNMVDKNLLNRIKIAALIIFSRVK